MGFISVFFLSGFSKKENRSACIHEWIIFNLILHNDYSSEAPNKVNLSISVLLLILKSWDRR